MKFRNKRGDVALINVIMFLVLNLAFVSVMFVFINYAGSRALIYEQSYAKQVALIIDNAKPDMAILLDVSEGLEVARKSEKDLSKAFVLKDGKVFVDLGRGGGYSYEYFTNYDVNLKLVGEELSIGVVACQTVLSGEEDETGDVKNG